jgi:hypothetical protein
MHLYPPRFHQDDPLVHVHHEIGLEPSSNFELVLEQRIGFQESLSFGLAIRNARNNLSRKQPSWEEKQKRDQQAPSGAPVKK